MSRKFVYYNSSRLSVQFLLDLFPADFAVSMRKLRGSYTGSCIKVRRDSDNQEQDIGFDGIDLDTTSLLNFVGSSNGYIVVWYNQGSINDNYIQIDASRQPLIVNNGNLITHNGLPTVEASGFRFLYCYSAIRPITAFSVGKVNTLATVNYIWGDQVIDFNTRGGVYYNGNITAVTGIGVFQQNEGLVNLPYGLDLNQHLVFFNQQSNSQKMDQDNSGIVDFPNRITPPFAYSLGGRTASSGTILQGYMSEFIFYSNDKLSDKSTIEANVNQYYGIY